MNRLADAVSLGLTACLERGELIRGDTSWWKRLGHLRAHHMPDGRILFFYRTELTTPPEVGVVVQAGETLFRVAEVFDEDGTTELILHPLEVDG